MTKKFVAYSASTEVLYFHIIEALKRTKRKTLLQQVKYNDDIMDIAHDIWLEIMTSERCYAKYTRSCYNGKVISCHLMDKKTRISVKTAVYKILRNKKDKINYRNSLLDGLDIFEYLPISDNYNITFLMENYNDKDIIIAATIADIITIPDMMAITGLCNKACYNRISKFIGEIK